MLQRLIAIALLLAAAAMPLPAYAAAFCAPHRCCEAPTETAFDRPDCCGPVVCAAPVEQPPASVPPSSASATSVAVEIGVAEQTPRPVAASAGPGPATPSPPPTRLRLAHLSTLLI